MSLDALVADLLVDELLQEDVLAGGDGLEFIAEIVDEGGGVVWVGRVDLEMLGSVEAMLEGVGGGASFALRGFGAGGMLRVGAIGGDLGGYAMTNYLLLGMLGADLPR